MKGLTIRIAVLSLAFAGLWTAADAARIVGSTAAPMVAPEAAPALPVPVGTLQKSNALIGMSVQDTNGQPLGTVVDLVLDPSMNIVTDVIVSQKTAREGWDYFAVPFSAFSLNAAGNAAILNVASAEAVERPDRMISRGWFQGPIDIQGAPLEKGAAVPEKIAAKEPKAKEPVVDIYGRPIEGKAMSPYVQYDYRAPVDTGVPLKDLKTDQSTWRGWERDQYGNPIYERDYYVGTKDFGHDGYTVQKRLGSLEPDIYGRPVEPSFAPSRSDWHWGESSLRSDWDRYNRPMKHEVYGRPLYGRPLYRDYGVYGRPLYDIYGNPIAENRFGRSFTGTVDRFDRPLFDIYGRPIVYDSYGRPLYRDSDVRGRSLHLDYDRYGRPLHMGGEPFGRPLPRERWQERQTDRAATGIGMGAWFRTDWTRSAERLGLRRVTKLIGTQVNNQGQDAGNIGDLVIDTSNGHVAYTIVKLNNGFAGAPDKMVAVPWPAVVLSPSEQLASLDISKPEILRLSFVAQDEPSLENMTYARRLHAAFNAAPYWETFGYVSPSAAGIYKGNVWNSDSWYAMAYSPANVTVFNGTIQSVHTISLVRGATPGIRLTVKSDDGRLMLVDAGPVGFATQDGITFSIGEPITVYGSRAQVAGKNVILASRLDLSNGVVQLRTVEGRPLW